ncbi:Intermediate filament protein, partial [Cladochytrium tenue]
MSHDFLGFICPLDVSAALRLPLFLETGPPGFVNKAPTVVASDMPQSVKRTKRSRVPTAGSFEPGPSSSALKPGTSPDTVASVPSPLPSPPSASAPGAPAAQASSVDCLFRLFKEVFELRDRGNWLRRQALSLVLQQLLGGTVERRVMEQLRPFFGEAAAASMVWRLCALMGGGGDHDAGDDGLGGGATGLGRGENPQSPGGESASVVPPAPARPAAPAPSAEEVERKLVHVASEVLGGMVGRTNARKGTQKLVRMFRHAQLNRQLVLVLLDELVGFVFPEMAAGGSGVAGGGG